MQNIDFLLNYTYFNDKYTLISQYTTEHQFQKHA